MDKIVKQEAEQRIKEFKQLDLSTKEGRIYVAYPELFFGEMLDLYSPCEYLINKALGRSYDPRSYDPERKKHSLVKSDSYVDDFGLGNVLEHLVQHSRDKNNNDTYLTHEDIPVKSETLLRTWPDVGCFYGHSMVKRCGHLDALTSKDDAYTQSIEKKCGGENLLPYLLGFSADISCDMINSSPGRFFIDSLYSGIEKGSFNEETAKEHPNYRNVAKSIVKADRLNRTEVEILLKLYSHYLQNGKFNSFSILSLKDSIRNKLIKVSTEASEYDIGKSKWTSFQLFNKMDSHKRLEEIYKKSGDATFTGKFCDFIDYETSKRGEYIDFLHAILNKYNNTMTYHTP